MIHCNYTSTQVHATSGVLHMFDIYAKHALKTGSDLSQPIQGLADAATIFALCRSRCGMPTVNPFLLAQPGWVR